jgi:sugar phosphate isomerase/epimerase
VHHTLVTRLSGGRERFESVFTQVKDAVSEITDYARNQGITVLYEPQGMLFNGYEGYSRLLDFMLPKHSNVGVCLDIGNTLWVDEDCYALAERYAHSIKHVHLKDYLLDTKDATYRTLSGRSIKEVALGKGVVDLGRVFDILIRANYSGCVSVEDNSGSSFEDTAKNAINVISAIK